MNKVVLLIVEGNTDKKTLGLVLSRILKPTELRFEVYKSDMTTERGISPTNISEEVRKCIKWFFSENPYLHLTDVLAVIQLSDTDGAFIPEDAVIEHDNEDIEYTIDSILTKHCADIRDRNVQKRNNLEFLCKEESIPYKNVSYPYRIYYMSCNLEHVLHDQMNANNDEKVALAKEFEMKCSKDQLELRTILGHPAIINSTSYSESWKYIMHEKNSLKRKSNFEYFFLEFVDK